MGTADETDWRLQGQDRYLAGATLTFGPYRRDSGNPDWDHDHCEFCGATFMVEAGQHALHEGYRTVDDHRWICPPCFADFRGRFGWNVVQPTAEA